MWEFKTQKEAENASNKMFKLINPNGTTERLFGWIKNENGKFELVGVDDRFSIIDGEIVYK